MKHILLGAVLLGLAAAPSAAQACKSCQLRSGGGGGGQRHQILKRSWIQKGSRHGHHKGVHLDKVVMKKGHLLLKYRGELDLTPDQQDKIKGALGNAKKKGNTLKAVIENLKIDIRAAMDTEKIDAAAVKRLIDKKYAAKAKLAKGYVDAQAAMQNVLTRDQLQDLRDYRYGIDDEDGDEDDEEEVEIEIKR